MATRPLRQYYDHDATLEVDLALGTVVEPWLRHRARFLAALGGLDDDEWLAPSRCAGWSTRDVVSHLVTVDGFFAASLQAGASGAPTSFLPGFDPVGMPALLVAGMHQKSAAEIRDDFAAGQASFVRTVESFDAGDWSAEAESPLGHVTARLMLAHALWDSWLHERDIFEPLGRPPAIEDDELFTAAWYSLFFYSVQGGLVGDDAPVGAGLEAPFAAEIGFDDIAGGPVRLVVDDGVQLGPAASAECTVSALHLVEGSTGRCEMDTVAAGLPPELAAQLERGRQIF